MAQKKDSPKPISSRPAAPVTRAATITAKTASGTIATGCRALTFISDATFTGTVLGMPLAVNTTLPIPVSSTDELGPVAFTRTAGTLYALEVR